MKNSLKFNPYFKSDHMSITGMVPRYATEGASGMDLHSTMQNFILKPGERRLVMTGLRCELPRRTLAMKVLSLLLGVYVGYELQMRPRSGLALKNGITLANTPGTIDADYRGDIGVILENRGDKNFVVYPGDRIAQLVVCLVIKPKITVCANLSVTKRGKGGFGSTGI